MGMVVVVLLLLHCSSRYPLIIVSQQQVILQSVQLPKGQGLLVDMRLRLHWAAWTRACGSLTREF